MKGATCHFCGQNFRNTQAVRAHLKGCAAYRQLPKATVPSIGSKAATLSGRGLDPGSRPAPDPGPLKDPLRRQPPRIATDLSPDPYQKVLCREVIQSVKDRVIGSWWQPGHTIPSEVKAQVLVQFLTTERPPEQFRADIGVGRTWLYRRVAVGTEWCRAGRDRQGLRPAAASSFSGAGSTSRISAGRTTSEAMRLAALPRVSRSPRL